MLKIIVIFGPYLKELLKN